eukprot:UN12960
MAADNPSKRDSLSQSNSHSNQKNNKFHDHIPVMDFQDYQAQQSNIQSSRDDMFLEFRRTKHRRFNKKRDILYVLPQ